MSRTKHSERRARTAEAAVTECSAVSSVARGADADLNGLRSFSSTLRSGLTPYGSGE